MKGMKRGGGGRGGHTASCHLRFTFFSYSGVDNACTVKNENLTRKMRIKRENNCEHFWSLHISLLKKTINKIPYFGGNMSLYAMYFSIFGLRLL